MTTTTAPSAAGGSVKSTKSTAKTVTKAGATKKKPPRKTKKAAGSTKTTMSTATQQAYVAARSAQMDLAALRNEAAARRLDPLWYKAEDVLPSVVDDTLMSESAKVLPEQLQIVEAALEKNNLTRLDVTPQAFACLLEQARRYAMEILTDSHDYAFVAGRTEIARADLMLATEFRPDHSISISTQLPKLNLLAQTVNRVPLPPIPTQCYSGVLLPPKHHQLTARTFDVVTSAQTARRMVQAAPPPPHKIKTGKKKPLSKDDKHNPSYGAARGRQIPVNLKSNVTKKADETKETEERKESGGGVTEEEVPKEADTTVTQTIAATVPGAPNFPNKKEDDTMNVDNEDKSSTTAVVSTSATIAALTPAAAGFPTTTSAEGGAALMDTSPSKP